MKKYYSIICLSGILTLAFALGNEPAAFSSGNTAVNPQTPEGIFSAKDFGAKGDGKTDDLKAIQRALDAAGKTGGRMYLPPCRYLVSGSLKVPPGVSVIDSSGMPQYSDPLAGTVILATGDRDNEQGPAVQNVVSHSKSYLSLSDCYFSSDHKSDAPLVEADGGKIQIRGCSFDGKKPSIALRKGLKHAIITENNGANGVRIINETGNTAIIQNNEPFQENKQ